MLVSVEYTTFALFLNGNLVSVGDLWAMTWWHAVSPQLLCFLLFQPASVANLKFLVDEDAVFSKNN